jgi:1,4-dihydroxy-2-naphthoate octaprenyltransferase
MTTSIADQRLPRSGFERWLYALKPASWPKLFVPAFLGQSLGASSMQGLDLLALGWGFGFTVLGLAFIVLLNDWGDRRVDSIKRRMFPEGCCPKTIPDRILATRTVGVAGVFFAIATLLSAAGAQLSLDRPFAFVGGLACTMIFVGYTLPPLRLNYRGGGELLEMLGVGVALPLYNVYLQTGVIPVRSWPWVAGFAALSLASGVASGLSDEQSDRAGGKRTFTSTFGNRPARRVTEACVVLGAAVWMGASLWRPDRVPLAASVPAVIIIGWNFRRMRQVSDLAVTNAFRAQGAYKRYLHRAVWHGTTVASIVLWLRPSFS